VLGVAVTFHPALTSGFRRLQIGPGDPRLINYLLEHSWRFVLRQPGHTSLWDPPFFHPVEGVGAYTDTMLGAVAPYGMTRILGADPGLAFQLWMMAALSLAYAATYLLLERGLGLGHWPAATGAFLGGFGSSRGASFNSPQLFTIFWGLLALYALARALAEANDETSRRAPRWIAAAAALLALQTWSAFYPAFFVALVLAVATVIASIVPGSRSSVLRLVKRHPVALTLSASALAVALAPLARAHLAALDVVGSRRWETVATMLPPLATWINPGESNLLYSVLGVADRIDVPSAPGQFSHGLGWVTTVVAGAGLIAGRRRPIAVVVLATTVFVILIATTWPGGVSLWRWVWEIVPGARAIRFPARIGMLLTVAGSIGLALLLDRWRGRMPRAAVMGLAALCLVEQPHRTQSHHEGRYRAGLERIARDVLPECETYYLAVADGARDGSRQSRPKRVHVASMWASLEAGVPTVNGTAGAVPPGWEAALEDPSSGEAAIRRALHRWAEDRDLIAADRMPWRDTPAR
jgi:hypothetical protein